MKAIQFGGIFIEFMLMPPTERPFLTSLSVMSYKISVVVPDQAAGFGKLHDKKRHKDQAQSL